MRVEVGGVKELFEAMVDVLERYGYVEAEAKTAVMTAYRIKPEISPVVGGYIIVRRARDPSA